MRIKFILILLIFFNMGCAVFNPYNVEDFRAEYPAVYGLVEMDENSKQSLIYYSRLLTKEKKIKRFRQLKEIYDLRDSFILQAIELNLGKNELYYERLQEKLHQELEDLGVGIISAEGNFSGVGPVLILEEKLKNTAPQDYQLYQNFLHFHTHSKGGEYPFLDMKAEQEMIFIGEQFLKNDTASRYWQLIRKDFYGALVTFFDIHKVISEEDQSYIAGNTYTAFWPYATNIDGRQEFISNNPQSKYSSALNSVINNISVIDINKDELYLVITDWNKSLIVGSDKRIDYLNDKKDIPHLLEVRTKNKEEYFVNVFRFYSEINAAEKALTHIKKGHPDAVIIKVKGINEVILEEVSH